MKNLRLLNNQRSDFIYTKIAARPGSDFIYTKNSARPGSDFIYTNFSVGRGPPHSAEAALMPTARERDANCHDVAALRAAFFPKRLQSG